MFRLLIRLILIFGVNLGAFWLADKYIEGFQVVPGLNNFFVVAGIFTLLAIVIKPILKLILSPVIVLTLGFGIFLINALMLYLLDKFLANLTITGMLPLIYATLLIWLVNMVFHFVSKRISK